VCGTGKNQVTFDKVPLDRATEYAAEDADVTLRLWQRLKPRLAREAATRVYELVDRPLVPVVAEMERAGIKVDRQRAPPLSTEFGEEIIRAGRRDPRAGRLQVHHRQPQAIGRRAVRSAGDPGGRKGKSGVYSTDVTELERIATATRIRRAPRSRGWCSNGASCRS
jgi:DNA polymerase-1